MLGTRIARLRQQAGMSQGMLARRLGITAAALGAYEQERRGPSAAMLVRLSEILGVSVDYLLTGEPVTRRDAQAAVRDRLADMARADPKNALLLRLLMELL